MLNVTLFYQSISDDAHEERLLLQHEHKLLNVNDIDELLKLKKNLSHV